MSQRPRSLAVAALLQALTGLAPLAFGVFIAVDAALGHADHLSTAVSVSVLTAGGGLLIGWVALGLWRAERWSRSPAVLTQLFALPVSISLIQSGQPWAGWPLVVVAVIALLLLLSRPVVEALYGSDGQDPDEADGQPAPSGNGDGRKA